MLITLVLGACAGETQDAAMLGLALPSRAAFEPVADALQDTCGTLDCHGQSGRNLRLFGGRGLRLAAMDNSSDGATTDAEYEASYWSVVGLEPEIMSAVVRDRGSSPERLLMIAKARGTEKHKGGILMKPGDSLDVCLRKWLSGRTDEAVCMAARPAPPPVAGREVAP